MRIFPMLAGGLSAGLCIIVGETILNAVVLATDWQDQLSRLSLPPVTGGQVAQAFLKLAVLGVFGVFLSQRFLADMKNPVFADLASAAVLWLLVWAWVQWGMVLAGYVTFKIAAITVMWGLVELPLSLLAGGSIRRVCERQGGQRIG